MKPWHQVVTPRKDLREGRPLDASEFAIHLHQVAGGTAPEDYRDPQRFFERTYITRGLGEVAVEVMRRLAGETVNASPVINLTTPFGGGKTHALTLLYHLFRAGPDATGWPGVSELLQAAGLSSVPRALVATFVGTEFDPVSGRSGPGEPTRMTPWGDLAWQLGGEPAYAAIAEQDRLRVRPGGDKLRAILPPDRPVLILMDEVLNFLNAARAIRAGDMEGRLSSLAAQFLSFLQTLTGEASARTGLVLVMALPKSEQEMTAEDAEDYARLQRLSSRVDRPYILSEGLETAEIIRRRLFEQLGSEPERRAVARAFVKALGEHRELLPQWFPLERAAELFEASYPFHPTVLSVFERKWQTLPSFQRTRGVLRMLALWVSQSYLAAYRGGRKEPLITLGMAPLEDPHFRAAVLEQLGESRLEGPITTDIAGPQAHAVRLDQAAPAAIRAARLHQAVAADVLFESSGGQVKEEANLSEIRLGLGAPDLELGHIETALNALVENCYYLTAEGTRYRFSLRPNLNLMLANIRASLDPSQVEERAREEVREVFRAGGRLEKRFYPERSGDLPNAPVLTLVVLRPDQGLTGDEREKTLSLIKELLASAGAISRTYKSALFFAVAGSAGRLHEAARKLLAWEALQRQAATLGIDESQASQIRAQSQQAARELREAVWQSYNTIAYLGPQGEVELLDLGLLHSSAGDSLSGYIEARLRQLDILVDAISPEFLLRHWPPALPRWPLRSLRDAFFSSPQLPRPSDVRVLGATLARGVQTGTFALAWLGAGGNLQGVRFKDPVSELEIDFSEDVVLVSAEEALAASAGHGVEQVAPAAGEVERASIPPAARAQAPAAQVAAQTLRWSGDLPWQKWATFYQQVLSKLVQCGGLRIRLELDAEPEGGLTEAQVNEIRQSFADLELPSPQLESTQDQKPY